MAAEFGWTSGELFDVPRGDGTSGLIWFLKGEPVRSLGPDHAVLGNGTHVFDRIERGEWIDRHAKENGAIVRRPRCAPGGASFDGTSSGRSPNSRYFTSITHVSYRKDSVAITAEVAAQA
jgi:hypothetical protein